MLIGVPRESTPGRQMVAATPKSVGVLIGLGHRVRVQRQAGTVAGFPDADYAAAGAELSEREQVFACELVTMIGPPTADEIGLLRPGALLAAQLAPARSPELLAALARANVTALAVDAVPRISRAQSLDVLSSMANLAGYRAVIEAAHAYGGLFSGQVTAAGKSQPARVFVVGAGVAGLAAVGAANSLGARVLAFDVRPEVAEQVESMGAEFVRLDLGDAQQTRADGYASELSGGAEALAAKMYDEQARAADVVITTALIPGRPAPRLITDATVAVMRPGSVLVDLAAANGGNVAGTVPGERVVTDNGVTILGYTDLADRLPTQASQLFGTNMVNLVKLLDRDNPATPQRDNPATPPRDNPATPQRDNPATPERDNPATPGTATVEAGARTAAPAVDLDDEVLRGMTVAHQGRVLWPPPPIAVSAAVPAAAAVPDPAALAEKPDAATLPGGLRRRTVILGLLAVLFALGATFSPPAFLGHLTVFALAVVVGFYVITNVTHALHTPLMSVTNAISGIIAVGALLQVGSSNTAIMLISLAGLVVASINIFGGFAVTDRMLGMFRRD
ncbi:Re/Si-specific NAD(P)(+) transhydrogenase subunit alpha [Nakamurella lactea]|uniref:Re/Si-specific NAD(P)(+) transhydrogenase subunit alpha n=1 Tax=Nakamurella lactea TaxID=459515 RepID=UPI0004095203|nr:Re/Si-specific NAD(P)(+) transhydrogenase subunit alpha [Nakamurella lactea]